MRFKGVAWAAGIAAGLVLMTAPSRGYSCGSLEGPACQVESGNYFLELPAAGTPVPAQGYPVLVHLHGWYSSGRDVLRKWHSRIVAPATKRGYAVIVPNGVPSARYRRDWSVRDGRPRALRDEVAFLHSVLADVHMRHAIDPERVLLSGFSRGAAMVWDIACHSPQAFTAFSPASGGFWDPLPETCRGPARLFHTHGWDDPVVPLEGRQLAGTPFARGDIFSGFAVLRRAAQCRTHAADLRHHNERHWVRGWSQSCDGGTDLRLTVFGGGHRLPEDWMTDVMDWFEQGPPPRRETQEVQMR